VSEGLAAAGLVTSPSLTCRGTGQLVIKAAFETGRSAHHPLRHSLLSLATLHDDLPAGLNRRSVEGRDLVRLNRSCRTAKMQAENSTWARPSTHRQIRRI